MNKQIRIQLDTEPYDNGDDRLYYPKDTVPAALDDALMKGEYHLELPDNGEVWLVCSSYEVAVYALQWMNGEL